MKKITKKQIRLTKQNLDKMKDSDEQFIFMLFKNKDGSDNITGYSYNSNTEKIYYYLENEIQRGLLDKNEN